MPLSPFSRCHFIDSARHAVTAPPSAAASAEPAAAR